MEASQALESQDAKGPDVQLNLGFIRGLLTVCREFGVTTVECGMFKAHLTPRVKPQPLDMDEDEPKIVGDSQASLQRAAAKLFRSAGP